MGNQCCVREEHKDLGNLNTQENKNEHLKFEFDNPPEEAIHLKNSNEYRGTIQTGRIPVETKDDKFNIFQSEIKNSGFHEENQNNENKEINNNNYNNENEIKKHDPPYWNESDENDLENIMSDISDNKSDIIFKLFNDIRMNIENYRNEFENNDITNLINEVQNKEEKGNFLIKNEALYFQLKECLLSFNSTPMSNDEKNKKILEDSIFKDFDHKNIYSIECPIERENDSVWNLLKNYKNEAVDKILTNNVDYCVICALPIKNSYNMNVIFLFLSN